MDDLTLKSIDLIFKLLPSLKSVTGERRREYFDKVLTPLYQQFEEIHDFYSEAMLEARDAIVRTSDHDGLHIFDDEPESLETKKHFGRILDDFFRKRQTDEHLRDALRQEAQQFLACVKWKEERRFLVLLCFYFLQRGGIAPDDEFLDREAEQVAEQGGIKHWDTPSMRVYRDLSKAKSREELLAALDHARHDLNQRYSNVRLAFKKVRSTIVMKT